MPGPEPRRTGPSDTPPSSLVLSPFRAVRYATTDRSVLARLTSPAYDLIDTPSRVALERADPYNVVRLILPRPDPRTGDDAYARAARTLAEWRAGGVLAVDPVPALYVYEMSEGGSSTRGLVGAIGLHPPAAGVILPHEDTMPGPVQDRLALTEATGANFEPIVLVYDGGGPAEDLVRRRTRDEPLLQFVGDDDVQHRVWPITDPVALATIAADLRDRTAVIADGHHRYAGYLLHQQRQRGATAAGSGSPDDGSAPWDRGLAYLVATGAHGPQVQPIHRILPNLPLADALALAAPVFEISATPLPTGGGAALLAGLERGTFALTDGRSWHVLRHPDPAAVAAALDVGHSAAWRALDVTLAHALLIRTLWQLPDDESTVRFGHDLPGTLAAVQAGGTALLLSPTPADSVLAVARAGERMPRKSTLFVPKPRTGLLLRCYADEL